MKTKKARLQHPGASEAEVDCFDAACILKFIWHMPEISDARALTHLLSGARQVLCRLPYIFTSLTPGYPQHSWVLFATPLRDRLAAPRLAALVKGKHNRYDGCNKYMHLRGPRWKPEAMRIA